MKNFILITFIITGMTLFSCQNDELSEFENAPEKVELRAASLSDYEKSIPIYCYYYLNGGKINHYYTTSAPSQLIPGTATVINGKTYTYIYQSFNLPNMNNKFTSSFSTNNGWLGYIFPWFQPGTVILKRYYSSQNNDYQYIVSNSEAEQLSTDYVYQGGAGYVYPGSQVDSKRTQEVIKLKTKGYYYDYSYRNCGPYQAIVSVTTKANGRVWTESSTYSFSGTIGEERTVSLPKGATVSVDLTLTVSTSGSPEVIIIENVNDVFDNRNASGSTLWGNVYQATYGLDYAGRLDISFGSTAVDIIPIQ